MKTKQRLSAFFVAQFHQNRRLACDEVGGFANSPFLRKCKITTYISFYPILLETILIQLFSHVELNTPQYECRKGLVILFRNMRITSNATRNSALNLNE